MSYDTPLLWAETLEQTRLLEGSRLRRVPARLARARNPQPLRTTAVDIAAYPAVGLRPVSGLRARRRMLGYPCSPADISNGVLALTTHLSDIFIQSDDFGVIF